MLPLLRLDSDYSECSLRDAIVIDANMSYFQLMQRIKNKKNYWPLLLMPLMALGGIYWKIQHDRFPYVGRWVGPYYEVGRNLIIEVTPDKQMFVITKGKGQQIKITGSYRMIGEAALVRMIKRNISTDPNNKEYYIGDDMIYDLIHYRRLKKNRTYTWIVEHKIMPKTNGSLLEVQTFVYAAFKDQATGETISWTDPQGSSTYMCHRVK